MEFGLQDLEGHDRDSESGKSLLIIQGKLAL